MGRRGATLVLAAMQAADLVVSVVDPRYGDAHLDHLGVPSALRPALPAIKAVAVVALVTARDRPRLRSATGLALVAYYSAAVTFHVESGDPPREAAPAAVFGALAATIV